MKTTVKYNYKIFDKTTDNRYWINNIEVKNNHKAFEQVEDFIREKVGATYDISFNHAGKTATLTESH